MILIGIALLGFLLMAIIGPQGMQSFLKGILVVIGLIVAYLAIGSQLYPLVQSATPHDNQIMGAFAVALPFAMLGIVVLWFCLTIVVRLMQAFSKGPPRTYTSLGHGGPPVVHYRRP